MKVHFIQFNVLIVLTIMLNACSEPVTYAPVKVVNEALPPDNGYVPQTLPGNTEGFANKQKNSQVNEQKTKPDRVHSLKQTVIPALKPKAPTVSGIKNDTLTEQSSAKTAIPKEKPIAKTDVVKKITNPAKVLTGSQNQKTTLSKSENTNLKPRLSDTIHPPKELENTEKNTQKNSKKLYKSIGNVNYPDKSTKKHAKTLDKLEISGNNNKISIFSSDNNKILKLNFQWPLRGRISRSFSQTDNKGIEITGKKGQTVHAAEAGKAVYCGHGLAGLGNLAIIKHNDVYLSAYANNSKLIVKEGQHVGKGQIIGQLGQRGFNKAALHFEIRKNGKPINPLAVLPQN